MKLAVHGLGRMGMQITRKLCEDGHTVIAHNRSVDKIHAAEEYGALPAETKQDLLDKFTS